ncbi:hypothetical protein STIAU_7201 [Stigmatella aurantiaca DW4/3-1]|uniref:Uncharacterized protein n=1 Tax=Stigmatella aurantiaca (strain DW4/3-1) TaxID=378806 RepID=Q08SS8_STIAD|nr:hypothetical protein STIAU_7201 [Stigmatella aurantiaca DW4/3-1]
MWIREERRRQRRGSQEGGRAVSAGRAPFRSAPERHEGRYASSLASFIASPMSMGLNLSLPCMAAICALSFFSMIFTKSSLLTVMVIFDSPSIPLATQSESFVRSTVQVPPPSPVMLKWMIALMSLPNSGFAFSRLGRSVSRNCAAVIGPSPVKLTGESITGGP